MEIKMMKVEELIPYVNNPRDNKGAIDIVASSIKEFGFKVPIVIDKDNIIVTGHTRLLASKKLGLSEVPCVVANDLSKAQIKAFRLADNKVSEYAEWDNELLKLELEGLEDLNYDMGEFDFNIEDLIDDIEEDPQEDEEKPEIEFSEELLEKHNYVVLYFDNEVDWLQAETLFDLEVKKDLNTKRDCFGVGRVINGAEALNRILGE